MRSKIEVPENSTCYLDLSRDAIPNIEIFKPLLKQEPKLIVTVADYWAQLGIYSYHFHIKANPHGVMCEKLISKIAQNTFFDFAVIDNHPRGFEVAKEFVRFGGKIFVAKPKDFSVILLG